MQLQGDGAPSEKEVEMQRQELTAVAPSLLIVSLLALSFDFLGMQSSADESQGSDQACAEQRYG